MIHPSQAEIMAPAGSYESLAAAIQAGADSVYF
jgi:putative protease